MGEEGDEEGDEEEDGVEVSCSLSRGGHGRPCRASSRRGHRLYVISVLPRRADREPLPRWERAARSHLRRAQRTVSYFLHATRVPWRDARRLGTRTSEIRPK